MAEHYLAMIPELYFLKNEIAALVRRGDDQLAEIRKTENVCFRILAEMLALRMRRDGNDRDRDPAHALLALYGRIDEDHRDHAQKLETMLASGKILEV